MSTARHVRIVCNDGHVTLTVADDGKGIPHEVLARFRGGAAPGIGLGGMRERLAEFGGKILVESSSGGSVVQASCRYRRKRLKGGRIREKRGQKRASTGEALLFLGKF
jgi:signal transduction histidine kinase